MSGRVDFHVHSNKSSDGDHSPAELVGFARDHGLRALSIADHDTVAAYPEAVELGRAAGVEVIPGIELTTIFGGREFHLLLPFVDWTSSTLAAGGTFHVSKLSAQMRRAVEQGIADAWEQFNAFKAAQIDTGQRTAAEGFGTREFLQNDYLARMASAVLGIYGNSKEEALYPAYYVDSEGGKLDGSRHRYRLRFPPGEFPPVNSFWSITLYELPASMLVANPLDRYVINSPMLPDLQRDPDGGLTLYVQHESRPGKDKESNWLPAPDGEFWVVMRLYWPKQEALSGRWQAPPLERI